MKIFDVSRDILNCPIYPTDPLPEVLKLSSIENGDFFNTSALNFCLHTGTHIDVPYHVIDGGDTADKADLDVLMGKCTVKAFFEDIMTGADAEGFLPFGVKKIFIKGYGKTRLDKSAAFALSAANIELIGTDSLTLGTEKDDYEVHRQFFLNGITVIEGLDLSGVQSGEYGFCALPLKISGTDAAPCRVVLYK